MRLTWGEFFEARENDVVLDELIDVDDHGAACYNLVIKRDGRLWSGMYEVNGEWGINRDNDDHVDFIEVRAVTQTVVVYERVVDAIAPVEEEEEDGVAEAMMLAVAESFTDEECDD